MTDTNNNTNKLADADYLENDKKRKKNVYFSKIDPGVVNSTLQYHCPSLMAVESLMERNFFVMDDFISPQEVLALRKEVAKYHENGKMEEGQIGTGVSGSNGELRKDMRDDLIAWLEGSESWVGPAMKKHILRMDIFTQKIAILFDSIKPELSWKGSSRSKIMASLYRGREVGARYVPHYDNPNKNGRKLTTILYLNPDWRPKDGGLLRLKTTNEICDISPLGGRLVCFWSDRRVPHEVMPAKDSDRYAITIWYLDAEERKDAERRVAENLKKATAAMASSSSQ